MGKPRGRYSSGGRKFSTSDDGIRFDSKEEHKYYNLLRELKDAGYIKVLKLQYPKYDVPLASTASKKKSGYYVADFYVVDYMDREHIIDVKGDPDDKSVVKIAMVEYIYGITVKLIKTSERKTNKCWKYRPYDTTFITEE